MGKADDRGRASGVCPMTQTSTCISRSSLKTLIANHGGKFAGPHVEHLVMEEQAFWRFLDQVIELAWCKGQLEVLRPTAESESNLMGSHVHGR